MLIYGLLLLTTSKAVSLRRDLSILYSRITIIILLYSSFFSFSVYFNYLEKGIGLYGGLLHITCNTQMFHIFLYLISTTILFLTAFYPRKVWLKQYSFLSKILKFNFKYSATKIINKKAQQILEYSLIILNKLPRNCFNSNTHIFIKNAGIDRFMFSVTIFNCGWLNILSHLLPIAFMFGLNLFDPSMGTGGVTDATDATDAATDATGAATDAIDTSGYDADVSGNFTDMLNTSNIGDNGTGAGLMRDTALSVGGVSTVLGGSIAAENYLTQNNQANTGRRSTNAAVSTNQLVNQLVNMLDDVNMLRRSNRNLILEAVFRHNVSSDFLRANVGFVNANLPENLRREYREIIETITNLRRMTRNNLRAYFSNRDLDPNSVFHDMQNPLDYLAGDLERMIHRINPDVELSSDDTDVESMTAAATRLNNFGTTHAGGNTHNTPNIPASGSLRAAATINEFVNHLVNRLDDINMLRRYNMHLLQQANDLLASRMDFLRENVGFVNANLPNDSRVFSDVIDSNSHLTSMINNTLRVRALETTQEPDYVYHDMQDPLDILAGNLQRMIHSINPDIEFSSDTDERIAAAVARLTHLARNRPNVG